MDRRTFIQGRFEDKAQNGNCGQQHCDCDEIIISHHLRKRNSFIVTTIAASALLCASVLALTTRVSSKTKTDEWLREKKETAIACGVITQREANSSWPNDNNNKNGCAHQSGTPYFLPVGHKRNKI